TDAASGLTRVRMLRCVSSRAAGLSLASILMLVSVAVVAAFTMAALASVHLNFSRQCALKADALNLAEGAVAAALSQMRDALKQGTVLKDGSITYLPYPNDW